MRPGGGKAKGAEFERQVCKTLSLWVSDGKREDIFWRSAMSGGRATVAAKRGAKLSAQVGDISAIDPLGNKLTDKFVVECKYYRNIKLETLFTGHKGGVYEFWETLSAIASKHDKKSMLIFKQNGMEPQVLMDWDAKNLIQMEWRIPHKLVLPLMETNGPWAVYLMPLAYLTTHGRWND